MAYLPHRRSQPGALGSISDVATAVRDVVEDPCLFPVAKLVSRLNDLQQPAKPLPPGAPPPPRVRGIGLCSAVRPLKAVTFIAERPWVVPVGLTAVFGLVFAMGFLTGRER